MATSTPCHARSACLCAAWNTWVNHLATAPAIIIVLGLKGRHSTPGGSAFPAVQNLLLAARGLGLSGSIFNLPLAREAELRELLAIPENNQIHCCLPIGYPTDKHGPLRRKPVKQVAYDGRFGETWAFAERQPDNGWEDGVVVTAPSGQPPWAGGPPSWSPSAPRCTAPHRDAGTRRWWPVATGTTARDSVSVCRKRRAVVLGFVMRNTMVNVKASAKANTPPLQRSLELVSRKIVQTSYRFGRRLGFDGRAPNRITCKPTVAVSFPDMKTYISGNPRLDSQL